MRSQSAELFSFRRPLNVANRSVYNHMMIRTYKFPLDLNRQQSERVDFNLWQLGQLYNALLEERRRYYKHFGKGIGYNAQAVQLPEIRKLFAEEWSGIYAQCLQQTAKRVDKAYQAFFRRCKSGETPGFPRFKTVGNYNGQVFPQVRNLTGGGIKLLPNKKLRISGIPGEVKVNWHSPYQGYVKQATINKKNGKYYILLTCENVPTKLLPKTGKITAIDLGLTNYITQDSGIVIDNPFVKNTTSRDKLAAKQRKMSAKLEAKKKANPNRRVKDSKNLKKAKLSVAKEYEHQANQRLDWLHKTANKIVKENDVIILENLNVKGMLEAKGYAVSKENISDACWGKFIILLTYKAESAGKLVVKVDPRNTSKTCSCCGKIKEGMTLADREYHCEHCGLHMDRDHNASLNIRRPGISLAVVQNYCRNHQIKF